MNNPINNSKESIIYSEIHEYSGTKEFSKVMKWSGVIMAVYCAAVFLFIDSTVFPLFACGVLFGVQYLYLKVTRNEYLITNNAITFDYTRLIAGSRERFLIDEIRKMSLIKFDPEWEYIMDRVPMGNMNHKNGQLLFLKPIYIFGSNYGFTKESGLKVELKDGRKIVFHTKSPEKLVEVLTKNFPDLFVST